MKTLEKFIDGKKLPIMVRCKYWTKPVIVNHHKNGYILSCHFGGYSSFVVSKDFIRDWVQLQPMLNLIK